MWQLPSSLYPIHLSCCILHLSTLSCLATSQICLFVSSINCTYLFRFSTVIVFAMFLALCPFLCFLELWPQCNPASSSFLFAAVLPFLQPLHVQCTACDMLCCLPVFCFVVVLALALFCSLYSVSASILRKVLILVLALLHSLYSASASILRKVLILALALFRFLYSCSEPRD